MEHQFDTAIVGGGIAGYTAALTAKHLLLDYLWLGEGGFGKLRAAEAVRNFPFFSGSGKELCARLEEQKEAEGIVRTEARIDGIYRTMDGYTLTAGKLTFSARTVILASGVDTKGKAAGEAEFVGRGVSYCAVCDGALYRGKKVVAVLSSPRYEEEARLLAKFVKTLTCICLYEPPMPPEGNVKSVCDAPKRIEGGFRVERLVCEKGSYPADGIFFLKDSTPPQALCGGLTMEGGHVKVTRMMETNLNGLFAAGDVTGRPYQYAKAAGEGCIAAHSVKAYLQKNT